MGLIDRVPGIIREVALKNGSANNGDNMSIGSLSAVHLALQKAYQNGDYNTIQHDTYLAANDLNPTYGNTQNNADKAFFQLTNPSDNTKYWLSIARLANNPYGYMWAYTPGTLVKTGAVDAQRDPIVQSVAQFGTYSINCNTLGISNQLWNSSLARPGAGTIATIVMTTVAKYIKNRITGALTENAVTEAVLDAGTELVAEGVVETTTWITFTASVGGLVVGAVVGAVVFFLIMFTVNDVYKDYNVDINVYNWDPKNTYIISRFWLK